MLSTLLILNVTLAAVSGECRAVAKGDPLQAYLITSGPGHGMYTRVGHSAIWVSGGGEGERFFNWGAYRRKQKNFLWKFFMGTAEYELNLMSRKRNDRRIERHDQMLKAQHLDLSPAMKARLKRLLVHNARPENRHYVYHWESQNCATMIRDVLDEATGGAYQPLKDVTSPETHREEVLRHLGSLGWAWFGWHFLASAYAERTYTKWDIMHIPARLMEETGKVQITEEDGRARPLVDRECILNEGGHGWTPSEPPIRWPMMWLIGVLLGLLFVAGLDTQRRVVRVVSGLSMGLFFLFSGALGSAFMFFYFASSLEGYGPNENWFYASPLTLLLVPFALGVILGKANWRRRLEPFALAAGGVAAVGMAANPFTDQVNIDFIGLLGVPVVLIALKLVHTRRTRPASI